MSNKRPPIYLMTDDEFSEMKKREDKESMLDSLLQASKNNTKFTTKSIRKTTPVEPSKDSSSGESELLAFSGIPDRVDSINISDDEWESMLTHFDDISPIDDITTEDMYSYRRRGNEEDEYKTMFDKEKSMLNDVLSDLQRRSKIINDKVKTMSGKGAYGVSKNFSDLIEAANSLDGVKLSVIKEIANLKKTAADLRLKDKRANPDALEDDNDTIASQFYKQIIGGGSKSFVDSSLTPYAALQGGIIGTGSNNPQDNTGILPFNISQPIPQDMNFDESDYNIDKAGYIANEKRNVDICVYRYEDGNMQFVAIDEDGEVVKNYELPSPVLLDSLRTKPTSNYAYDLYDRKYKIIDVNTSVDLDDIDDDRYDEVNDDDKYDY